MLYPSELQPHGFCLPISLARSDDDGLAPDFFWSQNLRTKPAGKHYTFITLALFYAFWSWPAVRATPWEQKRKQQNKQHSFARDKGY
jgi:hypothetical protein